MRRSPLPSGAAPLVRSRLRRRRALRRILTNDEELAARRAILLKKPCIMCGRPSQHCHHRKLRSAGGDHSFDNLVPLCWPCHDLVHRYPAYAREAGLIVLRHENPSDVPLRPLRDLPVAWRLRLTRPLYDHREAQRRINAQEPE